MIGRGKWTDRHSYNQNDPSDEILFSGMKPFTGDQHFSSVSINALVSVVMNRLTTCSR